MSCKQKCYKCALGVHTRCYDRDECECSMDEAEADLAARIEKAKHGRVDQTI